ncbi:MFS-type transporter SLC18B1-like [Patiria miniata]|uniref:Major facilitator superfamily (MFS) profile domain-containing protein n=1 Tax=Patiria miniata TaxID=46514 RepID=A0A913ZLT7_PATMI|nr:MFS-type transporter SLC18B1-like [Patiria miniata]
MTDRSQSEESNLNAHPIAPNGNAHVTGNNQWQETSLEVTPTDPSNPAAAIDGGSAASDGGSAASDGGSAASDGGSAASDGGSAAAPRSKFTLHQKITFLSAALTSFSTWTSYSVIAVFFPTEAEAKGMSKTVVGLVFSAFFIASAIGAPIWGKVLPHAGARFVFLAGAFVTGGCNILLGFVVDMPTLATFTGFTFAMRILEGLGSSACNTAVTAILAYTFPDNVGVATSLIETLAGMSFAIGPVVGGLFFNVGGFKLPFFVLGGFVWACVAVNYFLMPKIGRTQEETGNMIPVLKLPAVWVVLLAFSFCSMTFSGMDPVLALRLKQLGYNVTGTSLVFTGWGAAYGFTAVLWGYIADKKGTPRIMMMFGIFVAGIGFFLIGPAPFLNIPPSMALIGVALPFTSAMMAMVSVPTMLDILNTTKWYGIPFNLGLNGVVSGLWFAAFSLGAVLGPVTSSALTDYYGFDYATTVFACGYLVVVLLMCFFGVWEFRCGKGRRLPKHRLVVEATEEEKVTLLSKEA